MNRVDGKLFHITPQINIQSIFVQGLIPNFRKGLTIGPHIQNQKKYIWLTDDTQYILRWQAGYYWEQEHKPVILSIDTHPYSISRYSLEDKTLLNEFVCVRLIFYLNTLNLSHKHKKYI